ncbi:hypothetical protein EPN96_10345 [bacterium]|nr:MAG: hypothetical protein EPN96_10345 [bacterium]
MPDTKGGSWFDRTVLFALLALLTLAADGCGRNTVRSDEINKEIDVFGVTLLSREDLNVLKGVKAASEPCLKGCVYIFDSLDVSIGYGHDGVVRMITSHNPKNSIFGISPGNEFAAAREKILLAGFAQGLTPYKFTKEIYLLTFLVNESGMVFGISLEIID